jgi:hypothetical protein
VLNKASLAEYFLGNSLAEHGPSAPEERFPGQAVIAKALLSEMKAATSP